MRNYHCSVYNFTPFMNYPHFSTYVWGNWKSYLWITNTWKKILLILTYMSFILAPWYEIDILKVVWNLMNSYHLWIQVCPMCWRFMSIFSVWHNQVLFNEIMIFSNMVFDIKKIKKQINQGLSIISKHLNDSQHFTTYVALIIK